MATTDFDREIEQRLMADPAIQAVLEYINPRQARYLYWQTPDGAMFLYTTEKIDGKYVSAVYQPTGKGSRSGRRAVSAWKMTREVRHTTRKAAKARALALYMKAKE